MHPLVKDTLFLVLFSLVSQFLTSAGSEPRQSLAFCTLIQVWTTWAAQSCDSGMPWFRFYGAIRAGRILCRNVNIRLEIFALSFILSILLDRLPRLVYLACWTGINVCMKSQRTTRGRFPSTVQYPVNFFFRSYASLKRKHELRERICLTICICSVRRTFCPSAGVNSGYRFQPLPARQFSSVLSLLALLLQQNKL